MSLVVVCPLILNHKVSAGFSSIQELHAFPLFLQIKGIFPICLPSLSFLWSLCPSLAASGAVSYSTMTHDPNEIVALQWHTDL